jgi:hypothetical protein
MSIMVTAGTATTSSLHSYGTARLWALGATVVLAVIASGFLIPWRNRRKVTKLEKAREQARRDRNEAAGPTDAQVELARARSNKPILGVLLGRDNRLSTSTTIAYLWTLVIVWILLSLIIAWPSDWDTALKNLYPSYLLLLGGPYAAWVLARVAVSTKVANQTLQKPPGDGSAQLSDLVSGDDGNPDLFDMQYVMFNGVAMAFVVTAFVHAGAAGFVDIPWGLLFLTGGPAAVYVGNKAFAGNSPVIFSVTPTSVPVGSNITVYGQNFLASNATPSSGTAGGPATASTPTVSVLVGGFDTDVLESHDGVIRATIKPGTYPTDPLDVAVVSSTGANAILRAEVRVLPAPPGDPGQLNGKAAGTPAAVGSETPATGTPVTGTPPPTSGDQDGSGNPG